MHYSDFNSGNAAEDFKPSDIVDEEDRSDDEVLRKFKRDVKPTVNTKDALSIESNPSLGLKPPGLKASPRLGDDKSPYLIDPLQEKIHTLKNQLQ